MISLRFIRPGLFFFVLALPVPTLDSAEWIANPPDLKIVILGNDKGEEGGHNIHPTSDGGYIVAACVSNPHRGRDMGVFKLREDLSLDPGFADDGRWSMGSTAVDQAIDVVEVLDAQGRSDGYLVVGYVGAGNGDFTDLGYHPSPPDAKQGTTNDIAVVRLNQDGTPKTSFGRNGVRLFGGSDNDTVIYHPSNYSEPGNKILRVPGGFLIAGMTRSRDGDLENIATVGYSRSYDTWIFMIDHQGNFVERFADKGSLRIGLRPGADIGRRPANEYAWSIRNDREGAFVASGYHFCREFSSGKHSVLSPGNGSGLGTNASEDVNDHNMDGWLFRFDRRGKLCSDWAGRGVVFFGGSRQEKMYDCAATPDGGYVICGRTSSSDLDFSRPEKKIDEFAAVLAKVGRDGTPETGFGQNGRGVCFLTDMGSQLSRIENYGESDLVGAAPGNDLTPENGDRFGGTVPKGGLRPINVVRLDASGKPLRFWRLGTSGEYWVCGMDVDPRGRIVLTGYHDDGTQKSDKKRRHPGRDLVIMRFTPLLERTGPTAL